MKITGELEIDEKRGTIYFHTNNPVVIEQLGTMTPLQIGGLPRPIPYQALDIIHMKSCNWSVDLEIIERFQKACKRLAVLGATDPEEHDFIEQEW